MASIKETVRTFQAEPFLRIAKPQNLTVYCCNGPDKNQAAIAPYVLSSS
jgi:hypothetical protein